MQRYYFFGYHVSFVDSFGLASAQLPPPGFVGCAHIFPKSQFPTIATYYENLILLTSSQHRQKAHPKGNTQVVDKDYQLVCLMAKSQTIEVSLNEGDNFYRKESFVGVINTGLTEHLNETISFADIRKFLVAKYLTF